MAYLLGRPFTEISMVEDDDSYGRVKVIDDDMLTSAIVLENKGVCVPEIAGKLVIKTGKNAGRPSVRRLALPGSRRSRRLRGVEGEGGVNDCVTRRLPRPRACRDDSGRRYREGGGRAARSREAAAAERLLVSGRRFVEDTLTPAGL